MHSNFPQCLGLTSQDDSDNWWSLNISRGIFGKDEQYIISIPEEGNGTGTIIEQHRVRIREKNRND